MLHSILKVIVLKQLSHASYFSIYIKWLVLQRVEKRNLVQNGNGDAENTSTRLPGKRLVDVWCGLRDDTRP